MMPYRPRALVPWHFIYRLTTFFLRLSTFFRVLWGLIARFVGIFFAATLSDILSI